MAWCISRPASRCSSARATYASTASRPAALPPASLARRWACRWRPRRRLPTSRARRRSWPPTRRASSTATILWWTAGWPAAGSGRSRRRPIREFARRSASSSCAPRAYNRAVQREKTAISPITEIVAEIRAGRIVILVDDEDRENEGDLVFAAEFVSADKINFLAKHGRGLVCMPITEQHASRLGLRPMVEQNRSRHGTNFTVSIEAAEGIATGISAHDRALTIKVAAAADARPDDIVQPGHVFPLIAQPGGALVRAGHTEACCDLARLAGLNPAAVLCEIMRDDGSMARLPDLMHFAAEHQLKIG